MAEYGNRSILLDLQVASRINTREAAPWETARSNWSKHDIFARNSKTALVFYPLTYNKQSLLMNTIEDAMLHGRFSEAFLLNLF
jgi:hypothetical protein